MSDIVGWDIGGAHLKLAHVSNGIVMDVRQMPCALWQGVDRLAAAIDEALHGFPRTDRHALTMTGGDKMTARFMRCDYFDFVPKFKLWIVGNHKPRLNNVDEAMRRRMLLVPFLVQIPPEERDPRLAEKLKVEWPAILRWAIDGCLEWQKQRSRRARTGPR